MDDRATTGKAVEAAWTISRWFYEDCSSTWGRRPVAVRKGEI